MNFQFSCTGRCRVKRRLWCTFLKKQKWHLTVQIYTSPSNGPRTDVSSHPNSTRWKAFKLSALFPRKLKLRRFKCVCSLIWNSRPNDILWVINWREFWGYMRKHELKLSLRCGSISSRTACKTLMIRVGLIWIRSCRVFLATKLAIGLTSRSCWRFWNRIFTNWNQLRLCSKLTGIWNTRILIRCLSLTNLKTWRKCSNSWSITSTISKGVHRKCQSLKRARHLHPKCPDVRSKRTWKFRT